jgi:hypothetical protein
MRSVRPKFRGGGRSAKDVEMEVVFKMQDDEIEVVSDVTAKEAVAIDLGMTSIPSEHRIAPSHGIPDRPFSRSSLIRTWIKTRLTIHSSRFSSPTLKSSDHHRNSVKIDVSRSQSHLAPARRIKRNRPDLPVPRLEE